MTDPADVWFIRLPDGQTVRANSTNAVRHHLASGRIPRASRVRRSADQEWVAIEWSQDFADIFQRDKEDSEDEEKPTPRREGTGAASRLDPLRLQTVGVRGLGEELLAALDCTLVRAKLMAAVLTGAVGIVVLVLGAPLVRDMDAPWSVLAGTGLGLVLAVLLAACHGLLMQMTYLELALLRPTRIIEALPTLPRLVVRLSLAYILVGGGALAMIVLLRWLPSKLVTWDMPVMVRDGLIGLTYVLEAVLWPAGGSCFFLGAIAVVEECSIFKAIAQWSGLLRRHLDRVFFSEALAVAIGIVATLPFALPVFISAIGPRPVVPFSLVTETTLSLLGGLALAPMIAYVAVANIFLYLFLRYEYTPRVR